MFEVPAADQLTLGVGFEPVTALFEELAGLVLTDAVVLVVIEHGQQHV